MKQKITFFAVLAVMLLFGSTAFAAKKPNIVVIWGVDIGITKVSAYSQGLMG